MIYGDSINKRLYSTRQAFIYICLENYFGLFCGDDKSADRRDHIGTFRVYGSLREYYMVCKRNGKWYVFVEL